MTTRDRLLTATAMPGFNRQFTWRATGTRPREGRDPFGTCHKYAMTSIGATSVVVRSYRPAERGSDATAGHLVAEFADTMTARRAYGVLKSWRGQCEDELAEFASTDVGRLQAVAVPAGAVGGWYLLRYGPAGGNAEEAYFDAHGFARAGARVAVVQMRLVGQDYTYPVGKEPMVTAVKAAAGLLAP